MPQSGFQPGVNAGPSAQPTPAPPAPVEKPPIPAEHKVLQDTFEALRTNCLSAANHPVSPIPATMSAALSFRFISSIYISCLSSSG